MRNFDILLWDIDGTLLDFAAAESAAVKGLFREFGLGECSDGMVARYAAINKRWWEALERGEKTKPEILVGRFTEFFSSEGIDPAVAPEFNELYQLRLGDTVVFCDGSFEIVKSLVGKVRQYAVSNGTIVAQTRKLRNSGLDALFDGVFLSEDMMAPENREKLMIASYLGGLAAGFVGVVHPLSAGLSMVLHMHHGIANCYALSVLEDIYPKQYAEMMDMMQRQGVSLTKGICANLTDEQYQQLYDASIVHEKPLTNALGPDFRKVLTPENVIARFKRM